MARRKTDTRLALLYSERVDGEYFKPQALVVRIEGSSRIRNVLTPDVNGWPLLNDLVVDAIGTNLEKSRGIFGFTLAYHQPYMVKTDSARAMYMTLKRIEAALTRIYNARGPVKSFGEYVGRIAEALHIETIAFYSNRQKITSSYDDNDFRFESLGDGIRAIDWSIERWQTGQSGDK